MSSRTAPVAPTLADPVIDCSDIDINETMALMEIAWRVRLIIAIDKLYNII